GDFHFSASERTDLRIVGLGNDGRNIDAIGIDDTEERFAASEVGSGGGGDFGDDAADGRADGERGRTRAAFGRTRGVELAEAFFGSAEAGFGGLFGGSGFVEALGWSGAGFSKALGSFAIAAGVIE